MSKSRNHKWYYDDFDHSQETRKHKGKEHNRRNQKKLKNALKAKNLEALTDMED